MARHGYSYRQVAEMGFPVKEYDFPTGEGSFTGTLAMKKWNDNRALICYFDTDQCEKLKLCVWFKYDPKRTHRPRDSNLDITKVPIGTQMCVTFEPSKTGKTTVWLTASILDEDSQRQTAEEETAEDRTGGVTYV